MIIIWADSRWRDSFGLALLSYELDKLDVPNAVVSFDLVAEVTEKLGNYTSGTILNHTIGKRNREIIKRVKRNGGFVGVMPTEGKPIPENEKWFTDNQSDYDLLFSWTHKFSPPRTEVTGSPRFQIYTHYPHHIEPVDYVLDKYRLPKGKKVVTFVSAYPQAKFQYSNTRFFINDWDDLKRVGALENSRQSMTDMTQFQSKIRDRVLNSDDTVVIRPHPMEDLGLWERFQYSLKLETGRSTHLIPQEYIYNLLQVSDEWINKEFCTTILDKRLHDEFVKKVETKDSDDWASDVVTDIDSAKEIARLIKQNTNLKAVPRNVYSSIVDILKIHNGNVFNPVAGSLHVGKSVPLSVISGWKGRLNAHP